MEEYAERHSIDYDATYLGPKIDSHFPAMIDSGTRMSRPHASDISDSSASASGKDEDLQSPGSSRKSSKDFALLRNLFKRRSKPVKQTAR